MQRTWVWSPVQEVVKNLPASAKDIRDAGLIPGSGRSSGGGHGNSLRIHAWRTPWTGEPGGLQSIGSHRVGHDWRNTTHMHTPQEDSVRLEKLSLCTTTRESPRADKDPVPPKRNLRRTLKKWHEWKFEYKLILCLCTNYFLICTIYYQKTLPLIYICFTILLITMNLKKFYFTEFYSSTYSFNKYLSSPIMVSRRRQWHPTPVLLPGKSHGRRSLVGYSPWGC